MALADAALGRSHRAKVGKAKLGAAITQTKELIEAVGLPKDYHVGIVPASDTGAFEMAMWSLLGPKPVTCVHFESFGGDWYTDLTKQLKLENVTNMQADYGVLPDLSKVDWDQDVVFTYNGTTAGVRCPVDMPIPADRKGLTLCDATSAVFAQHMPWDKLDVVTFSWQKCLGGEGAHGMLILSPRAVERLESYTPPWPMPKIFRLTKKGKVRRARRQTLPLRHSAAAFARGGLEHAADAAAQLPSHRHPRPDAAAIHGVHPTSNQPLPPSLLRCSALRSSPRASSRARRSTRRRCSRPRTTSTRSAGSSRSAATRASSAAPTPTSPSSSASSGRPSGSASCRATTPR